MILPLTDHIIAAAETVFKSMSDMDSIEKHIHQEMGATYIHSDEVDFCKMKESDCLSSTL